MRLTEEKMLRHLRNQKADALEAMIQQYNSYVAAVVSAVLGDGRKLEDVEELVSDVFAAAWNHGAAIQPGKLKAYLGAIARNRAKSFLRKQRELPMDLDEIPALTDGQTPEDQLLRQEQQDLVRQAVLQMSHPDQEIFLRYYYYLQTTGEIARAMEMEPGTVRIHLMRGRNKLKQTLWKEDVF